MLLHTMYICVSLLQMRAGHLTNQEEEEFLRQAYLLIEKVKKMTPGAKASGAHSKPLEDTGPNKPSLISPPPDEPKKLHPLQDGGSSKLPLEEVGRQFKPSPEATSPDIEDLTLANKLLEAKTVQVGFREEVTTIPDTPGEELSSVAQEQGGLDVPPSSGGPRDQMQQCLLEQVVSENKSTPTCKIAM